VLSPSRHAFAIGARAAAIALVVIPHPVFVVLLLHFEEDAQLGGRHDGRAGHYAVGV
jgi:hypothetical protein